MDRCVFSCVLLAAILLVTTTTAATSSPVLPVTRTPVKAPFGFSAAAGTSVRGVFYYLGTTETSASIVSYDLKTKAWGNVSVSAEVAGMMDGPSFTGVEAVLPGIDDFLVVSGGGTADVVAYNVRTKAWAKAPSMQNKQKNACSTSCRGYWYSMTGDMKKKKEEEEDQNSRRLKPANRQVYRYNLTSGEHFENSGKKERGGAGCGCDVAADRVFWEGGSSDAGLSDNVEVWGADPLHRGGEPIFKAGMPLRDVGATACGGFFVGVGGTDKSKRVVSLVNVFNSSSSTDGNKRTFDLGISLAKPRVECLKGRYVLVSGGSDAKNAVNKMVYYMDTRAMPAENAKLSVLSSPLTGVVGPRVASATDRESGVILFFDGVNGELFQVD